jgi:uncharacterized membrane protein YbhN (UPF0104 family)
MRTRWAVVWRVVKVALAVLIVGGVSWHFAKILQRPELWRQPLRLDPLWLALTALLYAAGFCCWGGYWLRLLNGMGERLALPLAARAYFVSQLGKYVPGKAAAVLMRVGYARAAGVRTGVAAITATYETLTTIAAGAIVAAILFPLLESEKSTMGWKALGLLAIAGIPILPGVFNRLAARIAKPFLAADAQALPRLSTSALLSGLLQSSLGWFCLGTSLLTLLHAVERDGEEVVRVPWLVCTAYVSLSYVAGFLTLPAPGGLGVREAIMQQLLAVHLGPRLGEEASGTFAVVVVLLLRLTWTVTELSLAGLSALLPRLATRNSRA